LTAEKLAKLAAKLAFQKKAVDVVVLNLKPFGTVCDYFVICSGESERHVGAIADSVQEGLETKGASPWHLEGYARKRWVLIDYVDVVVHVFHQKTREYYLLERLWGDAELEEFNE
jgi:ribosome-associated protein